MRYKKFNGIQMYFSSRMLLERNQLFRVRFLTFVQIFATILDLVAIILMGIIGSIVINSLATKTLNHRVEKLNTVLGIDSFSPQLQVFIFGLMVGFLLGLRTFISVTVTRKSFFYLAELSAKKSAETLSNLSRTGKLNRDKKSYQELVFGLTEGHDAIYLGIIGGGISLAGDISLVVILTSALMLLNPVIALFSIIYFACIFFILSFFLGKRASLLGEEASSQQIRINNSLVDFFSVHQELFLRGTTNNQILIFERERLRRADAIAAMTFLPYVSKYALESSVLIGLLLLAGVEFSLHDASHATATLAVFLTAGLRIAPSLLRIQQIISSFHWSRSAFSRATEIILKAQDPFEDYVEEDVEVLKKPQEKKLIKLKNVSFSHSDHAYKIIDLNLEIQQGEFLAIVGPSGAGKSTLMQLMMGFLTPEKGEIIINNVSPAVYISENPGKIAYVPQDLKIIKDTLKANLLLGLENPNSQKSLIESSLKFVGLETLLEDSYLMSDNEMNSESLPLSGGEKQRLGIARAIVTSPSILFMDEATSNLDATTESLIGESLLKFAGKVTVVVVAHRLSTIRKADRVIYLDNGQIRATGSFDEVRKAIPDFDSQASLMGL